MKWLIVILTFGFIYQANAKDIFDCESARDEKSCLACNVYHEARGMPLGEQVLVAKVTLQRVKSKKFPNDVCSVVWQQNKSKLTNRMVAQFSWTLDGRSDKVLEPDAWDSALFVANFSLMDFYDPNFIFLPGNLEPEDLEGVYWYHAKYVDPIWNKDMTPVAYSTEPNGHIFYK